MEYAIELKDITKRFPGVVANDRVSIAINRGEIHALAGENGAGKSTLMNIIFGLYRPDEGQLFIDGNPVEFQSPRDSIKSKIGMVHQHFMLVPKMTVAENVIVGDETGTWAKVDREEAVRRIQEISERYNLNINPRSRVGDLSVPEQQRVEIIKVLYREAEILIFDEPTAVLTPQLIDEFCEILLGLKAKGKTILFISHELAEVMKVSDRVTVLRRGQVVGTRNIEEIDTEILTQMMVGRSVDFGRKARKNINSVKNVLEIKNLHYTNIAKRTKLNNFNLSVKEGEIMGIAGVDGNGQEEFEKCLLGILSPESGSILLNGKELIGTSIRSRKEAGLAYVAEDRQKESLILQYPVSYNLILGQHYHSQFSKNGRWLRTEQIEEHARKLREDFDIRCVSIGVRTGTLSGGNQQKIVIAREASNNPEIYVAIQPTRGLDIGAGEAVQETLIAIRNQGKGVLLISMELDEILAISDRIAVIFEGKIVDVVDAEHTSKEELGSMMLGTVAAKTTRSTTHEDKKQ